MINEKRCKTKMYINKLILAVLKFIYGIIIIWKRYMGYDILAQWTNIFSILTNLVNLLKDIITKLKNIPHIIK